MKVKVIQSCLTLCDPMDYTVHGILQARILEWVAFPFFRGPSLSKDQTQVSPHCRQILSQLSHKGRPGTLEWGSVPTPFPADLQTQESNQGLLHCRWILYQLSYQESPPPHPSSSKRKVIYGNDSLTSLLDILS